MWQNFFFGGGAVGAEQKVAEDFWTNFFEPSICEAIRFGLF